MNIYNKNKKFIKLNAPDSQNFNSRNSFTKHSHRKNA